MKFKGREESDHVITKVLNISNADTFSLVLLEFTQSLKKTLH